MGVWYCTREDVKSALDFKETARNNSQVDRAIESASRAVEGLLHRKFRPVIATRYFDWPNRQSQRSWKLYLDENDLISVTNFTSGSTTISASNYNLEPANSGPPYTKVELKLNTSASFGLSSSHQRDISITGLWGYSNEESLVATLAEALDDSETGVDVSNSAAIGVGDVLRADSERMIVTEKTMLDTTQDLGGGGLTALANDVSVSVTTGSSYAVGEVILIDSERMLITSIAGNTLTVKRAWDGSTLAAHTAGAGIYAPRTLTVTRGALGTTAASHDTATSVYRHEVPGLVKDLCIAEAIVQVNQETGGYAKAIRSGESEIDIIGRSIVDIRSQAIRTYGRLRAGAI